MEWIIVICISWIESVLFELTQIETSVYLDNSPPEFEESEITFMFFFCASLAALITFIEFPLVLIANKQSPLFPFASQYLFLTS